MKLATWEDADTRRQMRDRLAMAQTFLHCDFDHSLERALALMVEAENLARGLLRDRLKSDILDGRL